MMLVLEVLTLLCVSVAMGLALAHPLEFPGKLRLLRQDYETIQEIYYPGFTYGGLGEGIGLLLLLTLLVLYPGYGPAFWLTVASLSALVAMHAIYWFFIHPINSFWLEKSELKGLAATFFRFGTGKGVHRSPDWIELRNRWEYAHVARAILGLFSFVLLSIGLTR